MELDTDDETMLALSRFAMSSRTATALDEVLDASVTVAVDALRADSVHVVQLDAPHGQIIVHRRGGPQTPDLTDPTPSIHLVADYPPIASDEFGSTIRAATMGDPSSDTNDLLALEWLEFGACLTIPVLTMENTWGGIFVYRAATRAFDRQDVARAEVISTMAGAAINRLERHRDMQRLANTDPMTGLANRRAVDSQMESWASDPVLRETMTVILFDVNGLKAVNDTHGHASGDQLIRDVANLIGTSAGLLPGAVAARIGGDEFLLASPDAASEAVVRVVDDIARMASLLPMGGGVSCGSARGSDLSRTDGSPASRVRALLRMADSEQYRNKMAARQSRGTTGLGDAAATRAPTRDPATVTATITAVANRLLTADDPIEIRLSLVAAALCEVSFGAAWWVSRLDPVARTLCTVHCGTPRADSDRDGSWNNEVALDTTPYPIDAYPASARAVQGHSFFADRNRGEAAEQRLLIELGFSSVLCSGGVGPTDGIGWLIEVYGDALNPDLERFEAMLHLLTMLATEPRLV